MIKGVLPPGQALFYYDKILAAAFAKMHGSGFFCPHRDLCFTALSRISLIPTMVSFLLQRHASSNLAKDMGVYQLLNDRT